MNNNKNKPKATYRTFILNSEWHSWIIGFLVGLLMIAVYIWIIAGFFDLLMTLYHSYPDKWSHGAETMIKNIVIILAALELIRIFQSYLAIGRVKLTFILEVALVVLVGELIGFWYREYEIWEVVLSMTVIAALVALRIITIRHSPDS